MEVNENVAYWGMERWLRNFAYRVDPGVGIFALAGALALLLALVTVSAQAYRTARADSAEVLRTEEYLADGCLLAFETAPPAFRMGLGRETSGSLPPRISSSDITQTVVCRSVQARTSPTSRAIAT